MTSAYFSAKVKSRLGKGLLKEIIAKNMRVLLLKSRLTRRPLWNRYERGAQSFAKRLGSAIYIGDFALKIKTSRFFLLF